MYTVISTIKKMWWEGEVKVVRLEIQLRDFPCPVKNPSSNGWNVGLIPGWRTKILHATRQLKACTAMKERSHMMHELYIYNFFIYIKKLNWSCYQCKIRCYNFKLFDMNLGNNDGRYYTIIRSDQIRSVAQLCPTLCDPRNRSTPGLPVHHQLPESTETHVHQVSDAIQPSHPLSSPSLLAPNPSQLQSLFQWVNSSHEVAKVLEFQL